jgi:hypothetical protein
MKTAAAAAPTRPRPALRPEAAPVDSGSVAELVAEVRRDSGTDMPPVGWMTRDELGAPVLAMGETVPTLLMVVG